jgi:flagellar basal-body rod protein FlgB
MPLSKAATPLSPFAPPRPGHGPLQAPREVERDVRPHRHEEGPSMLDPHSPVLAKLMDVASLRARVHAANLANQNTPGYRAKAVAFEADFAAALASGGDAIGVEPRIYEPRDTAQHVDGNDVAPDREVLQSAENTTLYNAYIALARGQQRLITTAISPAP